MKMNKKASILMPYIRKMAIVVIQWLHIFLTALFLNNNLPTLLSVKAYLYKIQENRLSSSILRTFHGSFMLTYTLWPGFKDKA